MNCRTLFTRILIVALILTMFEFNRSEGRRGSSRIRKLMHRLRTHRLSSSVRRELVKRIMSLLSEMERNYSCRTKVNEGCKSISNRCHTSILAKRSLDSKMSASARNPSFWYDYTSGVVTEIQTDMESHHIVKRSSHSGRVFKIDCEFCREKCWK